MNLVQNSNIHWIISYCFRFNATSPAESSNNLIKRSISQLDITLISSRKEFDHALENHWINVEIKENTIRYKPLIDVSIFVSAAILDKIDLQKRYDVFIYHLIRQISD